MRVLLGRRAVLSACLVGVLAGTSWSASKVVNDLSSAGPATAASSSTPGLNQKAGLTSASGPAGSLIAGYTADQVISGLRRDGEPLNGSQDLPPWQDTGPVGSALKAAAGFNGAVAFADSRLHVPHNTRLGLLTGGVVELFATPADASSRYQQLKAASAKVHGPESQHLEKDFLRGRVVLRLDPFMSSAEVSGYAKALQMVLGGVA